MHYLVLEYRHGDFMPIDIGILLNNHANYNTLESIDAFAKNYTKNEIMNLIKVNNLVPSEYLNGTLEIINEKKYRFPLICKDNTFKIDEFINNNISNKLMMNKFVNIYQKYTKDNLDYLKKMINEKNINEVINSYMKLPYETMRSIYVKCQEI